MSDDTIYAPPTAPELGDLLRTTERDVLRAIIEDGDLIEAEGEAWLLVPLTPDLIDALAAFEADVEDAEDDTPAEEGADDEPILGAPDRTMDQEKAWRVPTYDLEYDGDNCPDPDLEDGWDQECDPADAGVGDLDGVAEQGYGMTGGEPSLGATEDVNQVRAWAQPDPRVVEDGEMQGTADDLLIRFPTIEEREAQAAAARAAMRRLSELRGW